MWFNSLADAQSYCDKYRNAPDRTIGLPREIKLADGTIKYYIVVRMWSVD